MYTVIHAQSGRVPGGKHVISKLFKAAALLSFDALVLEILLQLPYILWYRWAFQGERQFVVDILLFSGVLIAENGSQG